jgi:hypothetical protein
MMLHIYVSIVNTNAEDNKACMESGFCHFISPVFTHENPVLPLTLISQLHIMIGIDVNYK